MPTYLRVSLSEFCAKASALLAREPKILDGISVTLGALIALAVFG